MDQRYSPTRLSEIDAGRICVIKPSALGDVVQSLPLLAHSAKSLPERADFVGHQPGAGPASGRTSGS